MRSRCRWMNRPTASAARGGSSSAPLDSPSGRSPRAAAGSSRTCPRKSVLVGFAPSDLSGKIAHPAVHKAEISRAWAAMQEIADWLTRLGLPEYVGRICGERHRHTTEPPQPAPAAPPPTEAMGERRCHGDVLRLGGLRRASRRNSMPRNGVILVGAYIDAASAAIMEMGGKVERDSAMR